MKQTFLKSTAKKFIIAAFLTAPVLFAGVSARATVNSHDIEIVSGDKTNVQLTANTEDAITFKLHVNNQKGENFTVTIKNNSGEVLFSQVFNETDFEKQFKVLKGENEYANYSVTIASSDKSMVETYVISSTVRTVNDVAINKL